MASRRSLLCGMAGFLLAGAVRIKAEDQPAAPPEQNWKSLFDGQSMTGWKVTQFGTQGEIDIQDGAIHIGMGDGASGVTIDQEFPRVNYEVRLQAQRFDGNDFFCGMTFPVGDDPCSLITGGWGGALCGLSSIDGKDAARNDTKRFMKFEKKTWYTIRVRVTGSRILCWIDDKQIIDRYLNGQKVSIRPEVALSKPFGISTWNTTARLRQIEVRDLTAEEIDKADAPAVIE